MHPFFNRSKSPEISPILQSETGECGLAVVAMIANYFGRNIGLHEMRKFSDVGQGGMTLHDIIKASEELGLVCSAYAVDVANIRSLTVPVILHWNNNHFVILSKIHRDRFSIVDPAVGPRELSMESFSRQYSGTALELSPGEHFKPQDSCDRVSIKSLGVNVKTFRRSCYKILFLSLLVSLAELAILLLVQQFVDGAQDYGFGYTLQSLFGIALLVILIRLSSQFFHRRKLQRVDARMSEAMSRTIYARLLQLPMKYFDRRASDRIIENYSAFIDLKENEISRRTEFPRTAIVLVTILAILYSLSVELCLLALVFLVIEPWVASRATRKVESLRDDYGQLRMNMQAEFQKTLKEIRNIRLTAHEPEVSTRWSLHYQRLMKKKIKLLALNSWSGLETLFVRHVQGFATVLLCVSLVDRGALSIGAAISASVFVMLVIRETANMQSLIDGPGNKLAILNKLADIMLAPVEDNTSRQYVEEPSESIKQVELNCVEHVFTHNADCSSRGVNLKVELGEIVCVEGASQSDKEVVLSILATLIVPDEGQLLVNGIDVHRYGVTKYRRNIIYLGAETHLLDDTIEANIAYFDDSPDVQRVEECLIDVCLFQRINKLPLKFQTRVGDGGAVLSKIEVKQLLLARALYQKPGLVLIDEADDLFTGPTGVSILLTLQQRNMAFVLVGNHKAIKRASARVYSKLGSNRI